MKIIFFLKGDMNDTKQLVLIANELKKRNHSILMVGEKFNENILNQFKLNLKIVILQKEDDNDIGKSEFDNSFGLNQFYLSSIGFDLIICNFKSSTEALCVHEKVSIPFIPILQLPILNTKEFPHLNFTNHNLIIPDLNKKTYKREYINHSKSEIERIGKWRNDYLGLEPLSDNFFEKKIIFNPNVRIINVFDKLILPYGKVPIDYLDQWNTVGFLLPLQNQPEIQPNIPMNIISFLNLKFDQLNFKYIFDTDKIGFIQNQKDLPILLAINDNVDGLTDSNNNKQSLISNLNNSIEKFGKNQKWIILNNNIIKENLNNLNWLNNENVLILDRIHIMWLSQFCSMVISNIDINTISSILKSEIPSIITSFNSDTPIWYNRFESLESSICLNNFETDNTLINSILKINLNYENFKSSCNQVSKLLQNDSLEKSIKIIENK